MTDEEQKAWDMFAAAALSALVYQQHEYRTTKNIAVSAEEYADAMMEQRKARMV